MQRKQSVMHKLLRMEFQFRFGNYVKSIEPKCFENLKVGLIKMEYKVKMKQKLLE